MPLEAISQSRGLWLALTPDVRHALAAVSLSWPKLAVAVLAVAVAVFLMVFQGSLFIGFLRAAGSVPSSTEADLWITPRHLECFDFSGSLPARFTEMAAGVSGVEETARMVVGFASWKRPNGSSQIVQVVSGEGLTGSLPIPGPSDTFYPRSYSVDQSAGLQLGVTEATNSVEINSRELFSAPSAEGFGSFLGSPYVFIPYPEGRRILGLAEHETSFILVSVSQSVSIEPIKRALQELIPEATIRTTHELASTSGRYWMVQTGAGGGIALAGVLGFVVGMAVVSQVMVTMTMERRIEIALLRALGASRSTVALALSGQAFWIGCLGWLLGLSLVVPLTLAANRLVAWIWTPWWLPAVLFLVSSLMCLSASVFAVRRALSIEPGIVFRES